MKNAGLISRSHLRKENDILDRSGIGHYHAEPVNTHAESCRWRHAEFQSTKKIFIKLHGFFITQQTQLKLVLKTLALVKRVVQLRECVAQFFGITNRLKTLNKSRLAAVLFCKRTHFNRIISNESGLH